MEQEILTSLFQTRSIQFNATHYIHIDRIYTKNRYVRKKSFKKAYNFKYCYKKNSAERFRVHRGNFVR